MTEGEKKNQNKTGNPDQTICLSGYSLDATLDDFPLSFSSLEPPSLNSWWQTNTFQQWLNISYTILSTMDINFQQTDTFENCDWYLSNIYSCRESSRFFLVEQKASWYFISDCKVLSIWWGIPGPDILQIMWMLDKSLCFLQAMQNSYPFRFTWTSLGILLLENKTGQTLFSKAIFTEPSSPTIKIQKR